MTLKIYIFSFLFILSAGLIAQNNTTTYVHIASSPDTVTAGNYEQIKIYVVVDSIPLQKYVNVKIFFPKEFGQFAFDNNPPPFPLFPTLQHGYCRTTGNKQGLKASIAGIKLSREEFLGQHPFEGFHHDDNEYVMTVQLDTTFNVGDTLIITYGYGSLVNYASIPNFSFMSGFKVMIDPNRNGNFIYQDSYAPIVAKTKKANGLQLTLSTTGNPEKPSLLKAVIEDDNVSICPYFTGSFRLICSDPSATFNSILNFSLSDNGHVDVPVIFHQNGSYNFTAQLINSNIPVAAIATSNHIDISNDTMQIFWGEFHTHTEYSRDGTGDHAFQYAKYGAALDFFAQTDHADGNGEAGIDPSEWNDIVQNVIGYNSPGRFVTFLGYEESMNTPSGHYNLIFNAPDSLMRLVPNLPKTTYNNIQLIWKRLDSLDPKIDVITIPHHTGKIFSIYPTPVCTTCNEFAGIFANPKYKRIMEMYSGHGLGESYNPQHPLSYESLNATAKSANEPYYMQDALALREKLGIIASSDNHLSRATQKQSGAFAVIADSLERNNIFQHVKNRHTYATTGERIMIKFFVNHHMMGDEINLSCNQYPGISLEVVGTDVLQSVEILKWDFKNGIYTADHHPVFTVLKKYDINGLASVYSDSLVDGFITDSSLYYLRVKQKNSVNGREVWGWTSPVWVNKRSCIQPRQDTIIFFDAADSSSLHQFDISVKWTVANQVKADYYIVQRSKDSINFNNYANVNAKGNTGDTVSYTFHDSFPDNNILYYRVKLVTFFDSAITSRFDSVRLRYIDDSILSFSANLRNNGVEILWKSREYLANQYEVIRAPLHGGFTPLFTQSPVYEQPASSYKLLDELPLKDSSLYKLVMHFPNGTFKVSGSDTIYFVMDSIIDFYTSLIGGSVLISWKGVHEYNTGLYEVQKAWNNIDFTTIENVQPAGSIFDTANYITYDTMPLPGLNYYKITQTIRGDFLHYTMVDSQRIVSTGINSNINKQFSIKVLNSFTSEGQSDLTILTSSEKNIKGDFMIVDISGRVLYNQQATLPAGQGHFIFPTLQLPSNIYFLLFRNEDVLVKNTFYILDEH